jgi:hypothetical protein
MTNITFYEHIVKYFDLIGIYPHHRQYDIMVDKPQSEEDVTTVLVVDSTTKYKVATISCLPVKFGYNAENLVDKILQHIYDYEQVPNRKT